MDVITTFNELKKYNSLHKTIARVDIQRKNKLDSFHEGHKECIKIGKQHADKVLVTFTDFSEIDRKLNKFFSYKGSVWSGSKDVCLQWCLEHNVDIVFYPKKNELYNELQKYDFKVLFKWASEKIRNYYINDNLSSYFLYLAFIVEYLRVNSNLFKQDKQIFSWKEGYWRFCQKDFLEKYSSTKVVLVNPVYKNNLPYSSTLFRNMSQEEFLKFKEIIKFIIKNVNMLKHNHIQLIKEVSKILPKTWYLYVNIYDQLNILDYKMLTEFYFRTTSNFRNEYGEGTILYTIYI